LLFLKYTGGANIATHDVRQIRYLRDASADHQDSDQGEGKSDLD